MAHPLGHFKTITKHRHKVIRNCFKAGIFWQGLRHDLSKYSPTEFIPGAKFYLGTRSPNEKEREVYGYSMACMHHKGRNKHHFEYWYDYSSKEKRYVPVPMPERYLLESFCDRIAASKVYKGENYVDSSPLEYFIVKNYGALMHSESAKTLEEWLKLLAEKGEKAALSEMKARHRQFVKNERRAKRKAKK